MGISRQIGPQLFSNIYVSPGGARQNLVCQDEARIVHPKRCQKLLPHIIGESRAAHFFNNQPSDTVPIVTIRACLTGGIDLNRGFVRQILLERLQFLCVFCIHPEPALGEAGGVSQDASQGQWPWIPVGHAEVRQIPAHIRIQIHRLGFRKLQHGCGGEHLRKVLHGKQRRIGINRDPLLYVGEPKTPGYHLAAADKRIRQPGDVVFLHLLCKVLIEVAGQRVQFPLGLRLLRG